MANSNATLQASKNLKDDEFYTTYECIEKELEHYIDHFENKTVLCNCDDPFESNFCAYFLNNFERFKLKRLICTSYYSSKISKQQKTLVRKKRGFVLDVKREALTEDELTTSTINVERHTSVLSGNGDFRSDECLEYLNVCDIVVTNPPFSLFREFFSELMKRNKLFLIIGNQNALTYKEIFPFIKEGLVWTGYQFGEMKFMVPADSEPRNIRYWVDDNGQKWRSMGNAMWLTNLDNARRHQLISMSKKYKKKEYPFYDGTDVIHVKTIKDIPYDFDGIMGVPITIINKYNKDQIEIVGEANHGNDNEFDLFVPKLKGKLIFKRILIKNKNPGRKTV